MYRVFQTSFVPVGGLLKGWGDTLLRPWQVNTETHSHTFTPEEPKYDSGLQEGTETSKRTENMQILLEGLNQDLLAVREGC